MDKKAPYSGASLLSSSKYAPRGPGQQPNPSKQLVLASKPSTLEVTVYGAAAAVNPDVELARSVLEDVDDMIDGEGKKFKSGVVQAIANVRRKIELHRQLHQDSAADEIFTAIDEIFNMLKNDQDNRPDFLKQIKHAVHLWYYAEASKTREDPGQVLALQKQVHDLRLVIEHHQQVFQDYKAAKLAQGKNLVAVQDVVTRLFMEKKSFQQEVAELKETINRLQEKLAAAEQKATDDHEAEHRLLTKEIGKESAKVAGLEALISTLEKGEVTLKDKLNLAKQEADTLKADLELSKGEREALKVTRDKMMKSITAHTAEAQVLKGENDKLQHEIKEVLEKVSQLTLHNDSLEEELENDKAALQDALNKNQILKNDNHGLESALQELRKHSTNGNHADTLTNQQLADIGEELAKAADELEKWKTLGKQSYEKYRSMLPLSRQAQDLQNQLAIKETEYVSALTQIRELQEALRVAQTQQAHQAGQSIGAGPTLTGNAKYWKDKYEVLLQSQGTGR